MPHTVTLPWPPRELSPNARVHWAAKARAAKRYRETCGWLAKALGRHQPPLTVALLFRPPSRRRADLDNMLASVKHGLDSVAQAVGVDDSRWSLRIERGEPVRGGAVEVRIE